MASLAFTHGDYNVHPDDNHVWRAIIASLGLHALVILVYPHVTQIRLPEIPDRIEIEFFSVKAPAPSVQQVQQVQAEAPPEPPKVIPKPLPVQPVEKPKPVLAAPATNEAEYQVPEEPVTRAEPTPPVVTATPAPAPSESATQPVEAPVKEARPAAPSTPAVQADTDELTASDADAWGDYGEQLRSLVNKSKQYPAIAVRRHLEGDVTVVAQFVRGELTQVALAESSKHVPLDEEALRMVKKAIAQMGMKESLKKKTFKITIPVSFRLE